MEIFRRQIREAVSEVLGRIGDIWERFRRNDGDNALYSSGRETLASQRPIQNRGLELGGLLVVAEAYVGHTNNLIEEPGRERNRWGCRRHRD
jgi:hypothetical protein